jgi:hypothetical protein
MMVKSFFLCFLLPVMAFPQEFKLLDSIQLEAEDSITDFEADDFGNIYYIRNFSELNKIDNRSRRKKSFSNQTPLENLNTQNILQITVKSALFDLLVLDNQLNLVHDKITFPIEANFSPTLSALVDNNYLWGYDPVLQRLVLWNYRDKKILRQSVILSEKTGDEFYAELIYFKNKIYLIGYHKILVFDEFANLESVIPFQEFGQIYVDSESVYYSDKKKIYKLNLKTKTVTELLPERNADYFSINNDYLFVLNGKVVYLYESQKQS